VRSEQIVRGRNIGDPVTHGFADGVLECAAAVGDADYVGAEEAHAEDVETLTAHVFFAHVDGAIEAEERADGGCRDAVLPSAGFGDDAALAHARASSAWPRQLLILWAPVWSRSSRLM